VPNVLAAALAFVIPLVAVVGLLRGLRWYLNRNRPPMLRVDADSRTRRAQAYYWLGASAIIGLLGVAATLQHFVAGKPAGLGTWVVAGRCIRASTCRGFRPV
jgi:hypothetical protein